MKNSKVLVSNHPLPMKAMGQAGLDAVAPRVAHSNSCLQSGGGGVGTAGGKRRKGEEP